MRYLILLVGVIALVMGSYPQRDLEPPRLDEQVLDEAYPALVEAILKAIREVGGEPDSQHVHWVFGFSTGHFAADPTAAEAARYLASKLVDEQAKAGDQVSAYAWEMELWDHLPGRTRTITIQSKTPEYGQQVYALWPRTPRKDTIGGHDTERAIVEIVQEIGDTQDAVIILFTPTAASTAPSGRADIRVWGQNHPRYQQILKFWHRVSGMEPSGATIRIPYRVIKPSNEFIKRTLDVVILVPHQFAGRPVTESQRSTELQPASPVQKPGTAPPKKRNAGWVALFIFIVALVVAVAVAAATVPWLILKKPLSITINNNYSYALHGRNEGIVLTGIETVRIPDGWRKVVLKDAPKREFARIRRQGTGIIIKAENSDMRVADMTRSEYYLKAGEKARLEFYGEEPSGPGLPPQNWRVSVEIEVNRIQR